MKYTTTMLMSLLLLGVCSARTLDMNKSMEDMKRKDDDSSKLAQDYRRDDKQSEADDQKSQQLAELKETVYQKLRNTYQQLAGSGAVFAPLDRLPELEDPIEVGSVVDKYLFGTVSHQLVQFTGLHGAHLAQLSFDLQSHKASLIVPLKSAEIRGFYEASDLIRKTSGGFSIKMSEDVSYVCTYPYQLHGGSVQLLESTGELHYGKFDSHYENIGFFAQFLQNSLGRDLLKTVNEKVHHELHSKLQSQVKNLIEGAVRSQESDSVEKSMREGLQNAISGIQQIVSKQRGFSIDLTSDDKEMMHNKLHAKIASVKLNGIEKFYMAKNQVSEKSDKVQAKVELAVNSPTATAVISLHEAHDQDAPFQKITVDFDMDQLMAELSLDKPARQSGLKLRSVKTSVNRIRPVDTERFEGRVSYLIKEKMAGHMRRYIEDGLKNFIQKELSSIMSQGVQPQSQE